MFESLVRAQPASSRILELSSSPSASGPPRGMPKYFASCALTLSTPLTRPNMKCFSASSSCSCTNFWMPAPAGCSGYGASLGPEGSPFSNSSFFDSLFFLSSYSCIFRYRASWPLILESSENPSWSEFLTHPSFYPSSLALRMASYVGTGDGAPYVHSPSVGDLGPLSS